MLIKFENILYSLGSVLVLFQAIVSAAVVKQLNNSSNSQQKPLVPQTSANDRDEVFIPILSSNPRDNPDVPYFPGSPNYPHVQLDDYHDEGDNEHEHPNPDPLLRRGDEFQGDRRLPMESPDYYYPTDNNDENPDHSPDYNSGPHSSGNPNRKTTKKPKMYRAIERVYYYPQDDPQNSDLQKNKEAINQMKEIMPESYEPYYNEDDPQDIPEQSDFEPRKDFKQMQRNPPRAEHEDPEEGDIYASADGTGNEQSIAKDVREFGREAVDEAGKFEKFLDNLKNFAENSEKEYSSNERGDEPSAGLMDSDEEPQNENPSYRDSLAAHTAADDRTRDYETVSNYGNPDEYDSERNSYQKQKEQMEREQRGGHRYHKDRRRPKKSSLIPEEMYEQQNREVSGLIDSEPDEGDYLSNSDVVKQMKNSEKKYNTGVEPVYSSARDFDEVKRLEKMIENVALLNKQKEKTASKTHDRHESNEGSETKTAITKVKSNDNKTNKKDKS